MINPKEVRGVEQDLLLAESGKVYQTYVEFGDQWYVLTTTSKEVATELVKLSLEELELLCRRLDKVCGSVLSLQD